VRLVDRIRPWQFTADFNKKFLNHHMSSSQHQPMEGAVSSTAEGRAIQVSQPQGEQEPVFSCTSQAAAAEQHLERDRPFSRIEIDEFRSRLRKGMRIELVWRFGESLEFTATEKVLWKGTVSSENEDDDDARRALILYDGNQPYLKEASNITFPPPLLGNRQAEIWSARVVKRPTQLPDMGCFGRPAPTDTITAASVERPAPPKEGNDKKRDRGDDADIEHYEALASALSGEKRMVPVVEHLKVPRYINAPFDVMYPMAWFGRPTDWRAAFMERSTEHRYLPENDRERRNMLTKRDAFVSWLAGGSPRPATKEEWLVPFLLLGEVCAGWAYALGGYEVMNRFQDAFRSAWAEGAVDVEKIFLAATKPPQKQWRQPKNTPANTTTTATGPNAPAPTAPKNVGGKQPPFRGRLPHNKRF
jgi:hypothetical protein